MKSLDLDTHEVKTFPSQLAFAETTGYSGTIVNQWIKDPLHLPILGKYLIKRSSDNTPWRVPTQEEREAYFADWVLTRDPWDGTITEYKSAGECAKDLGLYRAVPNARVLSKGQVVFKDGLQYKRKNEKTPWRIFTLLELDGLTYRKNGEVFLNGKKL